MIVSLPVVCESVTLLGGSALLGKLIVQKPATVEQLVERVDMGLARKICSLAGDEFAESVWIQLCTACSMWHMIAQARLLAKIVIEIRKEHPGLQEQSPVVPVRPIVRAIRFAGLLSLMGSSVNAREFCKLFANLYAMEENSIVLASH